MTFFLIAVVIAILLQVAFLDRSIIGGISFRRRDGLEQEQLFPILHLHTRDARSRQLRSVAVAVAVAVGRLDA